MAEHCSSLRALLFRRTLVVVAVLMGVALITSAPGSRGDHALTLQGKVESSGAGLAAYKVSLYASFFEPGSPWRLLGSDISDATGNFQITYSLPNGLSNDHSQFCSSWRSTAR